MSGLSITGCAICARGIPSPRGRYIQLTYNCSMKQLQLVTRNITITYSLVLVREYRVYGCVSILNTHYTRRNIRCDRQWSGSTLNNTVRTWPLNLSPMHLCFFTNLLILATKVIISILQVAVAPYSCLMMLSGRGRRPSLYP